MRVILISGKARSGKDQLGKFLSDVWTKQGKKVLIIHYADFLKFFCKEHLGWDGEKTPEGRELLQRIGTNVVRKNNPNTWVDMMISLLKGVRSEYDYAIIPDTRFPNEIEEMKKQEVFNVTALRVERFGDYSDLSPEQQKHESECALDRYEGFKGAVWNDKGLDEYYETAKTVAELIDKEEKYTWICK